MAKIIFVPDLKPLVRGSFGRNLRGTLLLEFVDQRLGGIAVEMKGCLVFRDKKSKELRFRPPLLKAGSNPSTHAMRRMTPSNAELITVSEDLASAVCEMVRNSPHDKYIGQGEAWNSMAPGGIAMPNVESAPLGMSDSGTAPWDSADPDVEMPEAA
jgi:hypothetical protein